MSQLERDSPQRTRIVASDPKVELLRELKRLEYIFVTPSVATHRRVLRRAKMAQASDLRDVFGWSLPFAPDLLSSRLHDLLDRGNLVRWDGELLRSRVRVSSLGEDLLLHSAFPTNDPDAVFFGPDTYRFANFMREELNTLPARGVVVDVGAGAGAGAITAARCGRPSRLVLADINPRALDLAAANMVVAGLTGELRYSDGLSGVDGHADLIVANPPFIAGSNGSIYRDGGGLHGCQLSLDWAMAALRRLNSGGRLLLYTGSAIINGRDPFRSALETLIAGEPAHLTYRELDPDIFGGMLGSEAYADAERIAAVGVIIRRGE